MTIVDRAIEMNAPVDDKPAPRHHVVHEPFCWRFGADGLDLKRFSIFGCSKFKNGSAAGRGERGEESL